MNGKDADGERVGNLVVPRPKEPLGSLAESVPLNSLPHPVRFAELINMPNCELTVMIILSISRVHRIFTKCQVQVCHHVVQTVEWVEVKVLVMEITEQLYEGKRHNYNYCERTSYVISFKSVINLVIKPGFCILHACGIT